jgi:hypothetical protein
MKSNCRILHARYGVGTIRGRSFSGAYLVEFDRFQTPGLGSWVKVIRGSELVMFWTERKLSKKNFLLVNLRSDNLRAEVIMVTKKTKKKKKKKKNTRKVDLAARIKRLQKEIDEVQKLVNAVKPPRVHWELLDK